MRRFARVDPDSDFNFTLDEDGWITRVGYPKAEEPSGANPSLLSLIIDGPDGTPKFQKLARLVPKEASLTVLVEHVSYPLCLSERTSTVSRSNSCAHQTHFHSGQ